MKNMEWQIDYADYSRAIVIAKTEAEAREKSKTEVRRTAFQSDKIIKIEPLD
jgi:hypothetical protein